MRDLKYNIWSVRLSEEVIKELKIRRQNFKSWNLLFKYLLNAKKGEKK